MVWKSLPSIFSQTICHGSDLWFPQFFPIFLSSSNITVGDVFFQSCSSNITAIFINLIDLFSLYKPLSPIFKLDVILLLCISVPLLALVALLLSSSWLYIFCYHAFCALNNPRRLLSDPEYTLHYHPHASVEHSCSQALEIWISNFIKIMRKGMSPTAVIF